VVLRLFPNQVALRLTFVVVCLCGASVLAQAVRVLSDSGPVQNATQIFKVDREMSIPTYFSALLLLASAGMLSVIATRNRGRPYAAHWRWLALIFFYLSVDEAVQIHELANYPIEKRLGTHGFLLFEWVIPAAGLLLLFAAAYWRFWRDQTPALRGGLAAAGVLYVGSALGIEMVGGAVFEQVGRMDIRYAIVALTEEAGEMLAIVLLLRTLLRHLGAEAGVVEIRIGTGVPSNARAHGSIEKTERSRVR
jgi:hypothetical protein